MRELSYQTTSREKCTLTVGKGALSVLPRLIREGNYTSVMMVTDRIVGRLHGRACRALLEKIVSVHTIILPPGERSKDLKYAQRVLAQLARKRVDRHGLLIALGGGVVGDLTGFVASVYLRGIDYIQVPTSLMAQVDSAIGGKTGVDFHGIKNVVGTFYQPKAVVCDVSFLKTLSRIEVVNGMAEVIKYGLIGSRTFVRRLQGLSFERMPWEEVVGFCARMKAQVVARDTFDRRDTRALLNFGHTVGHALESISRFSLPHGRAIASGMVAAARMSNKLLGLSGQDCEMIETLLARYELPIRLPSRTNIDRVINVLQHDKKARGGTVGWVLLERIGKARAGVVVPEKIVRDVLCDLQIRSPLRVRGVRGVTSPTRFITPPAPPLILRGG